MMRNVSVWGLSVFLIVALFVVSGCGASATVSGTLGLITGKVYAAAGTFPLAGATVTLNSDSSITTTTDADGSFTLQGAWIVAGTYTFTATKGSFSVTFSVTVAGDGVTTDIGTKEVDPSDTNATIPDMAVMNNAGSGYSKYDYIERIISDLGYHYVSIEVTDLDNYAFVSTFEAIFINCGTSGSGLTDARKATLEAFVETAGNSLYISDWAADYIQGVWPTAVNWYGGSVSAAKVGNAQSLVATVVDSGLKTVLGKSTAEVFYDLGNWVIISSEGTGTSVLLSGSPHTNYAYSIKSSSPVTRTVGSKGISAFTTIAGTMEGVPLAVKFQPGGSSKGTVIYTTFHNEAQASDVTDDMGKVLKDFIFTL